MSGSKDVICVGLAQIAPVWINRDKTVDKVSEYILKASQEGCDLVVFGEGLLPGYPFWLDRLNGAEFDAKIQKVIHAHYLDQAVSIERGDLFKITTLAREQSISIYLGIIERPMDRGGHSLYCSLVFIDNQGRVQSVHRKLMPTYEERLAWSPGDGNGLVTHKISPFTVGGLNCWENWMPLARTALYAQGEDLHVSVWPGNARNTRDLLPVIARESRSFVIGVSGIFRPQDIPKDFPFYEQMLSSTTKVLADGGSCIVAPTGEWLVEPMVDREDLIVAEIDHKLVREERQNFDPVGHYSRPDVFKFGVNRDRQQTENQ